MKAVTHVVMESAGFKTPRKSGKELAIGQRSLTTVIQRSTESVLDKRQGNMHYRLEYKHRIPE